MSTHTITAVTARAFTYVNEYDEEHYLCAACAVNYKQYAVAAVYYTYDINNDVASSCCDHCTEPLIDIYGELL